MNDDSIYKKNANIVKRALTKGADPNFVRVSDNKYKLPALCYAVKNNYPQVIDIFKVFLNDPRTDVNISDKDRESI